MILKDKLLPFSAKMNSRLYLYGSTAYPNNDIIQRDIDALIITTTDSETKCISFNIMESKCNLYTISYKTFLEDLLYNVYGGYYSQKFALNFQLINTNNMEENPASDFWNHYYHKYIKLKSVAPDTASLCRFVHAEIYKYRPTFGRSLSKWLSSSSRKEQLYNEINQMNFLDIQKTSLCSSEKSLEESFYLFIKEYEKHKHIVEQQVWSTNTIHKMILSFNEINVNLISQYFEGGF
ncbi:MAG: hypothetical protein AB1432_16310 [Bacteroidota bacterium]